MKKRSEIFLHTIFLQTTVVLIGIVALVFLLWEPHIEGRNADATIFEIYLKDPFLAYAYIGSFPFFIALYQAFRLLEYARQGTIFSQESVRTLRTIKFCAIAIIGFVAVGEVIIMLGNSDDHAGGVVMGAVFIFASAVVGVTASMFERILQNTIK